MRLYILCLCIFMFGGCVDIKIASEMQKIEYFTLHTPDTQKQGEQACKVLNSKNIGLLDIYASTPFDSNSLILFDSKTLQVSEIKGKKWINSPKEMLKFKLLSKLQNKCFQVSIQPFGTQKFDKILKLALLGLQVIEDGGKYKAQMSVFYEVLNTSTTQSSKSGIITQEVELQSLEDESFAKNFVKTNELVIDKLLKQL